MAKAIIVAAAPLIGRLLLGQPNLPIIRDEAARSPLASSPAVIFRGTLMLTALALMQVGRALSQRSFVNPLRRQPPRTNKALGSRSLALDMPQMLVVYTPGADLG